MKKVETITIKEVLENAPSLLWSDALFLPDTPVWELETQGIIWDPDDVESEDDEIPEVAKEMNLPVGIGIHEIRQIVDNAKQQISACSIEQLFEAFLYYYNYDAFIVF